MSDLTVTAFQPSINLNFQEEKTNLNPTQKKQSFDAVLQQKEPPKVESNKISELENLRQDLINRYQNLPNGISQKDLLPEFITGKDEIDRFRKLLRTSIKAALSSPQGEGVRGRFLQVETEWNQLESMIFSNREFSQSELIALQAKLYQVSQHIDVLSKIVEQVTGSVKTILNTNV